MAEINDIQKSAEILKMILEGGKIERFKFIDTEIRALEIAIDFIEKSLEE